jgi:hypothetical protein
LQKLTQKPVVTLAPFLLTWRARQTSVRMDGHSPELNHRAWWKARENRFDLHERRSRVRSLLARKRVRLDIYLSCLIGGSIALAVFALCGLGFHHFGTHHVQGGSAPHLSGGHVGCNHAVHSTTTDHGADAHHAVSHRSEASSVFWWLAWFSPIYLCGTIIGFGLTGTLLGALLRGWPRFVLALGGAYILRRLCIKPVITAIANWASLPAKTLDDAVLESGTAATNFDGQGFGMVRLRLDGQVVQLLGQLAPEDQTGPRVVSGEPLFIRSVDSVRQRCVVCRTTAAASQPH